VRKITWGRWPPRRDLIHKLETRKPYLDTLENWATGDRLRAAKFRFVST